MYIYIYTYTYMYVYMYMYMYIYEMLPFSCLNVCVLHVIGYLGAVW